ncbi:MAG: methionine--tRNA ligase, partial [Patescibacteria group bacterium]
VHPRKIVDEYHAKNVKLFEKLGISFDLYTKTDTENHKQIVQDFFIKLLKAGYIFKKKTDQYYSGIEKRFLPDRYVKGTCPHCSYKDARGDQCDNCGNIIHPGELKDALSNLTGKPVTLKQTEHYFLNWPQFQEFLEKYIRKAEGWRSWVLHETRGWLEKGLASRAITRDLDWGIEIPTEKISKGLQIEGAENKRIYVWFEAVIGYFSASVEWAEKNKRKWKYFWHDKKSLHAYFMGKDNLVFHTLFWPAELYGYDKKLHLPDLPVINQFLNLEGQKFSKSRGITIDSAYFADTYGLDTLRFYLTLIAPEYTDTNFSWEDFLSKNNDIFIGNFANFINRTLTLAKGLDFSKTKVGEEISNEVEKLVHEAESNLENTKFRNYAETILALSDFGNKYLSKEEPWFLSAKGGSASGGKLKKEEKFIEVISNALYIVLALALISKPLLPNLVLKLERMLGVSFEKWDVENLKKIIKKVKVNQIQPLFKKLEGEIVEKERRRIGA